MEANFNTIEHQITLRGRAFAGRGYDPTATAFFWKNLRKSLYGATRITVYGASKKIGRPLHELSDVWNFRVEDEGADSNVDGHAFTALLPRVGDVIPQLFTQSSLFGDSLNPDDTVMDWLGDVANAVWDDQRDSNRLDVDLLNQLAHLRGSSKVGLEDALIRTGRYHAKQVHLNEELGERAEALVMETPLPRRTRILGFLDAMAFSDRGVQLILKSGAKLRVLWNMDDLESLRDHWAQEVVLEGVLQYKPNGQPQVLIAEAIRKGNAQDTLWQELPVTPPLNRMIEPNGHLRYDKNPLANLRGIFDLDVDDLRFAELVEAID